MVPHVAARPVPERRARERYGLLLVFLFASLFVQGAVPPSDAQEVVVAVLLGASMLLAFWAAGMAPRLVLFVGGLATALVILSLVRATTGDIGDGTTRLMSAVLVSFGPPVVAYGVLRSLRMSGEVRIEAVMGVLSLYMLIGMLFAFVFGAIDRYGGPFFAGDASATVARCLYYSFTTLCTVGYGDFTARSDFGHTLSVFEALIGQIYLVTVVSLIVGNLRRRIPERA